MNVLTVNAGSTSLKIDLVRDGSRIVGWDSLPEAAAAAPLADVVAHRLVHGGPREAPVLIDDAVRAELDDLAVVDPLHMQPALDGIDAARRKFAGVPDVACFDTSFHATIPEAARRYALPQPWRDSVPAYGFHGLSHAWSARRVRELTPEARRVVVAHLGGGSSLCGIRDGRSQITTMGFTPLDGMPMATRVGNIDPGAVLWLARQPGLDVGDLLSRRSGLQGLAGTPDMRELLRQADDGDAAAEFALRVYRHRFTVLLGGCVAALGGLDVLVFTGGIGEHAAALRRMLCEPLGWLGVELDGGGAARPPDARISTDGSRVGVYVIAAREELVMAEAAERLLAG